MLRMALQKLSDLYKKTLAYMHYPLLLCIWSKFSIILCHVIFASMDQK